MTEVSCLAQHRVSRSAIDRTTWNRSLFTPFKLSLRPWQHLWRERRAFMSQAYAGWRMVSVVAMGVGDFSVVRPDGYPSLRF